jgi:hypothetical protein
MGSLFGSFVFASNVHWFQDMELEISHHMGKETWGGQFPVLRQISLLVVLPDFSDYSYEYN